MERIEGEGVRDKDKGPVVSEAHREERETLSGKPPAPRSDWGMGRFFGGRCVGGTLHGSLGKVGT